MTQAEQIYDKHLPRRFHGRDRKVLSAIQEALDLRESSMDEYWAIENLGVNARIAELEKELEALREENKRLKYGIKDAFRAGKVDGYNVGVGIKPLYENADDYYETKNFGQ